MAEEETKEHIEEIGNTSEVAQEDAPEPVQ